MRKKKVAFAKGYGGKFPQFPRGWGFGKSFTKYRRIRRRRR